jgi:ABC-2 type transport system ATP-binding protein
MLKVSNLRKEYDTVVAVDGISLEVRRGELFGLLGPNGAGKTTTIRTVLNIIQPDSGDITFNGKQFTNEMWNIIGYLPEERGLYRKSKIINAILYFASLKGMSAKQAKPLAYYWLERFGLKNEWHRKIEELSKGNQQKIQLIISVLHNPELLILDEPFAGLDPVNQVLLKDILLELRQKNIAIVFSTHQMEQVEKMCDNICLINKGKQVLSGELREIKKQYGTNSVHLEFDGDGNFLKDYGFVRLANIYQNYAELELTDISKSAELLASINGKLALRKFEIVEPSLNSIFINVVGGPENIERSNETPIPFTSPIARDFSRLAMKDARVKKALYLTVFMAAMFVVLTMKYTNGSKSDWIFLSVWFIGLVISFVQFIFKKKKVQKELADQSLSKEERL